MAIANGMTVVLPPHAAEIVPLRKSSAHTAPRYSGCSRWQWLSMPPGSTSLPAASISSLPAASISPSATIHPFVTPMSQVKTSAAVATVPWRTTKS